MHNDESVKNKFQDESSISESSSSLSQKSKSDLSEGAKKKFDDGLVDEKMANEQHGQDARKSLVESEKLIEESKSNTIFHVNYNEMNLKEEECDRKDIISVEGNKDSPINSHNILDLANNKNIDEENLNEEIEVVLRKRKESVASNLRKNSHIHKEKLILAQNKLEFNHNLYKDQDNLNEDNEFNLRRSRKDSVANNTRKNSIIQKINSIKKKTIEETPEVEKLNHVSEEKKNESEKINEKVDCDKQEERNENFNPLKLAESPIKPKIIVKKLKIVNRNFPTKSAIINQQNEINILKEKLKLTKPSAKFLNEEAGLKSEKLNQETRVLNSPSIIENLTKHNKEKSLVNLNTNFKANDYTKGISSNKDYSSIKQIAIINSIKKEQSELSEKLKNNIIEDISTSKKVKELLIKKIIQNI